MLRQSLPSSHIPRSFTSARIDNFYSRFFLFFRDRINHKRQTSSHLKSANNRTLLGARKKPEALADKLETRELPSSEQDMLSCLLKSTQTSKIQLSGFPFELTTSTEAIYFGTMSDENEQDLYFQYRNEDSNDTPSKIAFPTIEPSIRNLVLQLLALHDLDSLLLSLYKSRHRIQKVPAEGIKLTDSQQELYLRLVKTWKIQLDKQYLENLTGPSALALLKSISGDSKKIVPSYLEDKSHLEFPIIVRKAPVYRFRESGPLNFKLKDIFQKKDTKDSVLLRISKMLWTSPYPPNIETFNIMIRQLTLLRQNSAAKIVYDAMVNSKIEIDLNTIVSLVSFSVVLNDKFFFARLFKMLFPFGLRLEGYKSRISRNPTYDIYVYGSLLNAAVKWNIPHLFQALRAEYIHKGIRPSLEILTMEIQFGAITKNFHIAEQAWKQIVHLEEAGALANDKGEVVHLDYFACFWMRKACRRCKKTSYLDNVLTLAQSRKIDLTKTFAQSKYRGTTEGKNLREVGLSDTM